jgi:hypothetical protein
MNKVGRNLLICLGWVWGLMLVEGECWFIYQYIQYAPAPLIYHIWTRLHNHIRLLLAFTFSLLSHVSINWVHRLIISVIHFKFLLTCCDQGLNIHWNIVWACVHCNHYKIYWDTIPTRAIAASKIFQDDPSVASTGWVCICHSITVKTFHLSSPLNEYTPDFQ